MATTTMSSQLDSVAPVWIHDEASATTLARPMTEPTERSMPPAVMTKVMPMLMTPMIEA